MVVLKSLGAVGAGFMTMVVLILVSTPLFVRLMHVDPAQPPTPPYLTVNLLTGFAFAGLGGWIAAHLAPAAPHWHAVGLATIVLVLGIGTAAQGGAGRAGQPQWYAWTLPFIGAGGALLGGWW
jgi:hypothetical protein